MLVMGSIVGAGIFNRPSAVAAAMGSTPGIFALWILGGVFAFTGAIVFAELGGLLPHAGGQYVFVREAYGRFAAFMFGWVLLVGISSSALAFVAGVFAEHVEILTRDLAGVVYADPRMYRVLALALIVFVSALNALGVRLAAAVQNISMLTKIAGLAAIVILGALVGARLVDARVAEVAAPVASLGWSWSTAGVALLSVTFAYGGWQNVAAVSGEIVQPERTLPLGILFGTIGVIALYLAFNAALIAILGVEGLARTSTPTVDAARAVFAGGGTLVAGLVVISTFAFVQGLSMLAPRIYFAMARDGVFFSAAGRVHPRWKTPALAIAVQGLIGAVHVWFGGEELGELVEVCTLCDLVFFASCGFALFVLRRKLPDAPRPYRALWYPWLPAVFAAGSTVIAAQGFYNAKASVALTGAALFALGIALYVVWNRGARGATSV